MSKYDKVTCLLSIVVPTKDRYKYLKQLISFIDGFNINEIELVIQDNTFENSEILEFLNRSERMYLKYFHTEEQLPIYLNVDLAINHSRGEYVCVIGDDDGVLPNIIDCVKWMKKKNIDALRPAITIYNWPDFWNSGKEDFSGALFYNDFSLKAKEIDVIESLKKLANSGFGHIYTIPKVYQGIVKRKCLDEIYKIGGSFSPGSSPDMATAVALSFVVKKFVTINIPVILVGQSQNVGGGERKLKGGVKDINDLPFLPKFAKENWDDKIPKVWCSQTVWPESAVKAIQYMNRESDIKINYEIILAKFIRSHHSETKLALQLSNNRTKLFYYLIYLKIERVFLALRWRVIYMFTGEKPVGGGAIAIRNINNIEEASNYLMKEYAKYTDIEAFNRLQL